MNDTIGKLITEQVESKEGESMSASITDDELIKIIDSDIKDSQQEIMKVIEVGRRNEDFWRGEQPDELISRKEKEIFVNRILISIESIASVITSEVPPPWIVVSPRSKSGQKAEHKLSRELRDLWEYEIDMQKEMETVFRNYSMYRVGWLKVFWNERKGRIDTKHVRLEKLRFDPDALEVDDTFVAEYVQETFAELIRKFPEQEEYLEKEMLREGASKRSKVTYVEYWGDYIAENGKPVVYTCWKYKKKVLGRQEHKYWNKSGSNHFTYPRKPYIPLNSLRLGKSIIDPTSLVEQAIPLSKLVNKRKRQINDNAWLASGLIVASADALDKETFDAIDSETRKVLLKGGIEDVGRGFAKITGRSLDSGIYEDMYHSIREIDNLFGSSDVLRGERGGPETLGGRKLLLGQSLGRQELTRRAYEQVAEEVFNWWVQLMHVYYKEPKMITSPRDEVTPEDTALNQAHLSNPDQDKISKKDLQGFAIKVIVKRNSTRTDDPEALKEEAITLKQTGNLNPLTFFDRWAGKKMEDPRKEARREFLWNTKRASLFPELMGAGIIDVEAIRHIQQINDGRQFAEDETFKVQNEQDIMRLEKHVSTQSMYIQGIEVDEDLPPYDSLPLEIRNEHTAHLEIESLQLQNLLQGLKAQGVEEVGPQEPEQQEPPQE